MSELIIVTLSAVSMFLIMMAWVNLTLKEHVKRCKQEFNNKTKCKSCINKYDGTNCNGYQPCGCKEKINE